LASSGFDTFLYLIGTAGQVIAYDDDGGGGTNSRMPAGAGLFTLPSSGTYMIEVTTYSPGAGGSYTLYTSNSSQALALQRGVSINGASVVGNKLVVLGDGFDEGAVILLNGKKQKTTWSEKDQKIVLISKKAAKKIVMGETVVLRVRNSDGSLSDDFEFTLTDVKP
jgi:hypothetical protein